MMRQIYITANGALTRPDGGLLPRRRGLCWRIRFANVLSPDLPTRVGRFLGRRRAADDQGSGFEGRDGRRRVPERRPREHDYGDVPDHGSEGRPSRRPRISRLPVPLDDLREEAEVPRARLCVEVPEARDFHLRDAAPDGDPPARRVYPPEVGERPRVPADRPPGRIARGRRSADLGRAAGVGGREHGPGPRGTGEARDSAARVRDDRRGDRRPLERGTVADVDVIALLAEARLSVPDATAAVSLVR